jgi:5-formyltetrahydrofolate cyclo-ligase
MDKHDWSMDFIVTPDEILVNSSSTSFDAFEPAGSLSS